MLSFAKPAENCNNVAVFVISAPNPANVIKNGSCLYFKITHLLQIVITRTTISNNIKKVVTNCTNRLQHFRLNIASVPSLQTSEMLTL